jgi:hypothetical protein
MRPPLPHRHPGIRPLKGALDDQKRVQTPEEAIRAGANYLVVGSPIRDAADPAAAARNIVASMERGAGIAGALGRNSRASAPRRIPVARS